MPKAAASEFLRLLTKELQTFAEKYQFSFETSPTVLGRLHGGTVVHRLGFGIEKGLAGSDASIMPLYLRQNWPGAAIIINMADYSEIKGQWSYRGTKEETTAHVGEISKLLHTVALPFFQRYGSPKGIIQLLHHEWGNQRQYRISGVRPYIRFMFIAYSYLYLGQVVKAEEPLRKTLETLDRYNIPDDVARAETTSMLELIQRGDEAQIRTLLAQVTSEMKKVHGCEYYSEI